MIVRSSNQIIISIQIELGVKNKNCNIKSQYPKNSRQIMQRVRGRSQTMLTRFWLFFDHLPPCVAIFYGMNVDKMWTF